MSELLPSGQSSAIREGLVDYLRTTFALADADAGAALQEFLEDGADGIFKGPFLRLRLPFKPAVDGWRDTLEWFEGFPPYGHQAAAFARLSGIGLGAGRPRPEPTLITTGTGSGKTEAFLYPILDHVIRAKRAGVTGMKALILYPMNALANDQAQRLATMITESEQLSGVTAALYTGQTGPSRTKVTADGLITDRAIIRDEAPDILLTNYKMLDQLLLRSADAALWEQSATSLQYLVLDEFHTYDGAQGTDVTMLLRRLGLALKSHWARDDARLTEADWERPLGRITPVATSATLGDKGDPDAMLEFARVVFGDEFGPDAVVTESRLPFDEWAAGGATGLGEVTAQAVADVLAALPGVDPTDGAAIARAVLGVLAPDADLGDAQAMLHAIKGLPLTRSLVAACAEATALSDLAELVPGDASLAEEFLLAYAATLSHVRAVVGREALSVDLHLWVRELTRIDRSASLVPDFHWSDDGAPADDDSGRFPAIYCRHCGRSGWGVRLAPVGEDLDQADPSTIRRKKATSKDEQFRPLIFAPLEGEQVREGIEVNGFRWFWAKNRRLSVSEPDDQAQIRAGHVIPVLTHVGEGAGAMAVNDQCPSCLRKDGIRFLGSAIATMLSVSVSTLFGSPGLDTREKKALVFTDSVQDAAHRAGFVQARSHTLTLRSVIQDAVAESPATLEQIVDEMIAAAGDDPHERYRLLPPALADEKEFAPFWQSPTAQKIPARVRTRVKRRLLLDVELEFGLQSRVGRTLELTGTASAQVDVPRQQLLTIGRQVLDEARGQQSLDVLGATDDEIVGWVRGVLERMRERGAIHHEWFTRYQREDGKRFSVWGGRPRAEGMPAFPAGRAAPGYPRKGGTPLKKDTDLDAVTGAQTWFALWTSAALHVVPLEGAALAGALLDRLARNSVIEETRSDSGASIYRILPSAIVVAPVARDALRDGQHRLVCSVCRAIVPGSAEVVYELDGMPCMVGRCAGRLERAAGDDNFYRSLYSESDAVRVVAREHTGQLPDVLRREYESGFRSSSTNPDAPNVLVATPTLEMGIDIGDLSTVMLSSLPRSVASYLQRVGRAGRLTGNALNLAFVTGRGDQLPRLGDPLSVINGEVRPPATYVDAEEILRRQYIASVADRLARDPAAPHPTRASLALSTEAEGDYLRTLIRRAEDNADEYVREFLAGFPTLRKEAREALRDWASPAGGDDTSGLAQRIYGEALKWRLEIEQLEFQRQAIDKALPELDQVAASPAATEGDKAALRTAKAARRLVKAQIAELRGEYWIAVLEHHGLLPNYTLFDDSVSLDVAFSWIDPDSGAYQDESVSFSRGAALALREFAPGASFYARGYRVRVDAVDLGRQGSRIHEQAYCPACGFVRKLDGQTPDALACPRCGATAFGDVQQRLSTVELERVSSVMRREEAAIDDSVDERDRERFTIVVSADVDPDKVSRQWFVKDFGFGVRHLRDMTIQWTNVGRAGSQGQQVDLSGDAVVVPRFRVCVHCGQLDASTLKNQVTEHRPWCPQRRKPEEDTRLIALTRSLVTEGLVVRLPASVTMADEFAVPSLSAALLLGLRERIGGAPDHIAVETIVDPDPRADAENHQALLLHDVVPGGTGYLADLSQPEEFRAVLLRAWEVVSACECQHENRLACHRCLLPFAPGRSDRVSRVTAERHLRAILAGEGADSVPEANTWELTDVATQTPDPETQIERQFRRVLRDRLEAAGLQVTEKPGPNGNRMIIRADSERRWELVPQENLGPARPDFLLKSDQPLPWMAIFCDGWAFHASPQINRLADDARKRADLRDLGHLVIGVTWRDVQAADVDHGTSASPSWLDPAAANMLKQAPGGGIPDRLATVLAGGPIDSIIDWIQSPAVEARERLADLAPLANAGKGRPVQIHASEPLALVAAALLDGDDVPAGPATGWLWFHDSLVLVARHAGGSPDNVEVAVVLDDRPDAIGPDRRDPWNAWISLANALNLRSRPTTVTTYAAAKAAAYESPQATGGVPSDWSDILAVATTAERELIDQLAARGVAKPTLGAEVTDEQVPLSVSWPERKLVLDIDLEGGLAADLIADGWQLLPVDLDAIEAALTDRSA